MTLRKWLGLLVGSLSMVVFLFGPKMLYFTLNNDLKTLISIIITLIGIVLSAWLTMGSLKFRDKDMNEKEKAYDKLVTGTTALTFGLLYLPYLLIYDYCYTRPEVDYASAASVGFVVLGIILIREYIKSTKSSK